LRRASGERASRRREHDVPLVAVEPREDAQHVAVDRRDALAEGDRRDGSGGVGTDARDLP